MQNLNEVLSLEDNQAIILAVGEIITPKIKERDQFDHLSKAEKTFIYLDIFEAALHTGDFSSFFWHSGQFTHEIIKAYQDIKAFNTAQLLEQAVSFFPEQQVPKNDALRQNLIEKLPESTIEKWDSIFEKFFESAEPVADLLANYIRENKSGFIIEINTDSNV